MLPYMQIVIPTYAFMAFWGAVISSFYLYFQIENYEVKFTDLLKLIAFMAIGCIVGSKLLSTLTMLPYLTDSFSPLTLITAFVESGLVFYGGLFGALIGVFLFTKRNPNFKFDRIMQMVVPILPLFHAFGRIGCYCAGCCYGVPLDTPINLFGILQLNRFPTQPIEALFELTMFFILWRLSKCQKPVNLLCVYLMAYASFRFGIEFYRGDTDRGYWFFFSTSQWISIAIFLYYVYFTLRNMWKKHF